jgi:hypothetical protein
MGTEKLSLEVIRLGQSSPQDVINHYGPPSRESERDGLHYFFYRGDSIYVDSVAFKDGLAAALFINFDPPEEAPRQMMGELVEPEATYFSHYGHGAETWAYPSRGVTFTVTAGGLAASAQYYRPCDMESYRATFGAQYPKKNPFAQM